MLPKDAQSSHHSAHLPPSRSAVFTVGCSVERSKLEGRVEDDTTSLTTTTRQAGPTRQRPTTIGTNGKKILQTFFPTRHTKSQEPDGLRTDSKHRTLNLTSFSTLSSCCCCCRTTLRAAIAVFRRTKIPFTSLVPATTTTAAASTKVRSSCFPDHHPLSRPRTRPLSNPAYRDRSLHYSNIWKRQLRDPAPDDFPAQLGFDRRRRQKKQRDQIFWRGEQLYDWKPEREDLDRTQGGTTESLSGGVGLLQKKKKTDRQGWLLSLKPAIQKKYQQIITTSRRGPRQQGTKPARALDHWTVRPSPAALSETIANCPSQVLHSGGRLKENRRATNNLLHGALVGRQPPSLDRC